MAAAKKIPVLIRLPLELKAQLDELRDLAPMQGYLERVIRKHVQERRAEEDGGLTLRQRA